MKLVDFICFKATVAQLGSTERNAVITEMVGSLCDAGALNKKDKEKITRAIIRRENEASTGLGKAVAVPHVKTGLVKKPVAVVGLSKEGIDFRALDKQPVFSVILLVSPENNPESHLKAMENVFGHLQKEKFRSFLRQAGSPEEVEDLLREADENPEL
ncbi:MAG: PTS sugar transporter subunit IIA [Phycisphaerae bacterium]|jgi:mannitol/fructose-specific phosphotransferase system IIA component (Ntr-type)